MEQWGEEKVQNKYLDTGLMSPKKNLRVKLDWGGGWWWKEEFLLFPLTKHVLP